MRIIIATGIYPPQVGGPAQYAKKLKEHFEKAGHTVKVLAYRFEHKLPTGIRHMLFCFRTIFALPGTDFTVALDTFSVGFPAVVASRLFGKEIIIRTGGDFLWEGYVERTGDKVLLRDFYDTSVGKWNLKEKTIFKITRWTLKKVDALVFSTAWQKDIFEKAYSLDNQKSHIIENYYGPHEASLETSIKNFVAATRPLKWKNIDTLKHAFEAARKKDATLVLDTEGAPYGSFFEKIQKSYAVILASLGDISPNMIMDAIRAGKPFILTQENGIYNRIKDIGIFVDPKNETDIAQKILWLSDDRNYKEQKRKIEHFNFTHGWEEICAEFIALYKKI